MDASSSSVPPSDPPDPRDASDPPGPRDASSEESTGTVLVAAAANLGIAVAKAVGGAVSGSGAMLSEAAHSTADTVTELLLLTALKRSGKPADEDHPLGHGGERYVWALLASVATFVGGAVFAVHDGIHTLTHGEDPGDPLLSYLVLALAFLLEGASLLKGVRQARGEAARFGVSLHLYMAHTPDTAVKAVVMEDSAALAGLVLAAGGLLGGQLTGSGAWDGAASICIGLLLVYVAWVLGRSNARLLIGRPLPGPMRDAVRAELRSVAHIVDVLELVTLVQGPREVLVAAKIDFRDVSTAEEIEWACEDAEQRLRARFPAIRRVFLDPTPGAYQRRPGTGGAETGVPETGVPETGVPETDGT
ncbi:cation diffusion facilitator family transporter [Streptomyces sp. NPDC007100]|uniref:cation diffusion facilitator family transporter n=1 Tax=Streptomyces sp. NPDC007100 TaxID=3155602 RepID=UPI003400CF85